jgi:L-erythro-3,5-diaminohexanoate dehydrogenase
MLTGVVDEVGPASPLGLRAGQRVATLVSLSLTPLVITDGLARWDGGSEQVPCEGHAILFGRSIATVLPDDLPAPLALAVLDVCGAPALTHRVVSARHRPVVAIIGAAGKSGSLSAVAARQAGASKIIGVVRDEGEAAALRAAGQLPQMAGGPGRPVAGPGGAADTRGGAAGGPGAPACPADHVVVADARDPVLLAAAVQQSGGPADVTVVCVDVPGCEGGAILATAQGTVIFFSMATSFTAAALGAEGLAADVTMLIGNGYVPGHAGLALGLIREHPGVRKLFESRIRTEEGMAS